MVLKQFHDKIAKLKHTTVNIKKVDWSEKIKDSELGKIFKEETIDKLLKSFKPTEHLVGAG